MTFKQAATLLFQSTPPARGATYRKRGWHVYTTISIHAPREGGDHISPRKNAITIISIHAPREGGDLALIL